MVENASRITGPEPVALCVKSVVTHAFVYWESEAAGLVAQVTHPTPTAGKTSMVNLGRESWYSGRIIVLGKLCDSRCVRDGYKMHC